MRRKSEEQLTKDLETIIRKLYRANSETGEKREEVIGQNIERVRQQVIQDEKQKEQDRREKSSKKKRSSSEQIERQQRNASIIERLKQGDRRIDVASNFGMHRNSIRKIAKQERNYAC